MSPWSLRGAGTGTGAAFANIDSGKRRSSGLGASRPNSASQSASRRPLLETNRGNSATADRLDSTGRQSQGCENGGRDNRPIRPASAATSAASKRSKSDALQAVGRHPGRPATAPSGSLPPNHTYDPAFVGSTRRESGQNCVAGVQTASLLAQRGSAAPRPPIDASPEMDTSETVSAHHASVKALSSQHGSAVYARDTSEMAARTKHIGYPLAPADTGHFEAAASQRELLLQQEQEEAELREFESLERNILAEDDIEPEHLSNHSRRLAASLSKNVNRQRGQILQSVEFDDSENWESDSQQHESCTEESEDRRSPGNRESFSRGSEGSLNSSSLFCVAGSRNQANINEPPNLQDTGIKQIRSLRLCVSSSIPSPDGNLRQG